MPRRVGSRGVRLGKVGAKRYVVVGRELRDGRQLLRGVGASRQCLGAPRAESRALLEERVQRDWAVTRGGAIARPFGDPPENPLPGKTFHIG